MGNSIYKPARGFTILELILVMVLITIIALVTIPKIISPTKISAIVAAEQATADIRAVQNAAMYQGVPRTITFNGNSYTAEGLTFEDKNLPGGAAANYTVTFNTFGEPDQGGSFFVSCGGDSRRVNIEALTGKVSITLN